MEYKKVEKCTRRDETRQKNYLLKERSEKCNLFKTTDPKILDCTSTVNAESRRELKINREEINLNADNRISKVSSCSELIKDANFENEEEWDIGGIPELLNELDADIEKSLTNIQTSKIDGIKVAIGNKEDLVAQSLQPKHCGKEKVSKDLKSYKSANSLKFAKNKITSEKNTASSTFTGFSKGGHLISTNSISLCSVALNEDIGQQFKTTKHLEQGCPISMSSQGGNNGNTSGNIGGTGINITCGQSISGSNSNTKPNNKMSIDHQATLDKGLKMKIKRTKPGTKSSEAKHEIVKATELQQNGLIGTGSNVSSANQDDISCLLSSQSTSSNSQICNVTLGINNSQGNSNIAGNKKSLGSGNNQNNMPSTSGNLSLSNTGSAANSVSISQGNKRGSSGHRRDKTKEKSSHSNRLLIEKNSAITTEKETTERALCHCTAADGNVSTCSNSSCIRKTEHNARLPGKNACGTISVVPPGVFTPSSDTSTSAVVSNVLPVTSAISTPISTQTISKANTPGPPIKEACSSNNANVKISSHIAAQLAAAAASNSSTSSISSSFQNSELKLSSSNVQTQAVKQLSPSKILAGINQTISVPASNQKISSGSSEIGTEKSSISTLKNENSESPPAKKIKHSDSNSSVSSNNMEMVDVCVGTSVGTITEPDCLGPCEPGTSVTLEGIVWHETEGGVLVVNVTWRGKTYVGTLLDCTRHDWAPPRFCDSPTEDLDARTSKGRGKRSRATITPDLSNFTETRSSIYFSHSHVHSKLRNGSTKGGRGTSRNINLPAADKVYSGSSLSSGNSGSTPSSSPTSFLPPRAEKRKSKDESPPPAIADNESVNSGSLNASGMATPSSPVGCVTNQPQSLMNPVTGLNVQISTKKSKPTSPCAISPVLIECPENDCSKKYRHVNGLRYHQSHAHGNTSLIDEDSMADTEDHITPQASPLSSTPTPSLTPNPSDLIPNNQIAVTSLPTAVENFEECDREKINEEDLSQQLENSENSITETVSSLPCDNILISTASSSTTPPAPSTSENISSGTVHHEQQKHFRDIVDNEKISINSVLSLESTNQAILQNSTRKSGVLRFGQEESKNNSSSCLLSTKSQNEILFHTESLESDSSKKCHQDSDNATFCTDTLEKTSPLHENQHNIMTNKISQQISLVGKPKKERKSPPVTDFDAVKLNSCNVSAREDVQSPAYSDISDDSTPVNESDNIEKVDAKNSDIIKKPQDIGLSASPICPSSHTNISSTLSGFGVYQFYQQQQYMVQPTDEQQQFTKNSINSNIMSTNISPSLTQQQNVLEFTSKKDPPLDLISKANSNQSHSNQHSQEISMDATRAICVSGNQNNSELPPIGPGALNSTTPTKPVSHFYAFNYMPSNYPLNVEHNFGSTGSIPTSDDNAKCNRLSGLASPNEQTQQQQQQHNPVVYKEDRPKDEINTTENVKTTNLQISSKQLLKSESMIKSDCIKQETPLPQIPQHMQIQNKDHQGIGVYTNMYQRHPLALPSQQLSREEELRRYYIFSDQPRRQNSSSHNAITQQIQNSSGNQQCKDDLPSSHQHSVHSQQQIKMKGNIPLNISKSNSSANISKESPKHKQEEELKMIKQEGQKPTMETQGPPPPPTSQYFLHPSYMTSTPFGFDPSHPMYRNVLMPAASPYNTPPYHLPMPRYHAPEDLSRNTGTKALDALHHAATQYYTTHKIHELSERALKSPNNSNSNNASGTIKISGSSPNIGTTLHSNISSNIIAHHTVQNQTSSVTQLSHNLASQTIGLVNKQDISVQKSLASAPGAVSTPPIETQKQQTTSNSSVAGCSSGNVNNNTAGNINSGNTSDSRSPPPQRHVHTHHHTHVGLGYPMYPAPYGAAVLASQQAAAVAVINPFPPGPNK